MTNKSNVQYLWWPSVYTNERWDFTRVKKNFLSISHPIPPGHCSFGKRWARSADRQWNSGRWCFGHFFHTNGKRNLNGRVIFDCCTISFGWNFNSPCRASQWTKSVESLQCFFPARFNIFLGRRDHSSRKISSCWWTTLKTIYKPLQHNNRRVRKTRIQNGNSFTKKIQSLRWF